MVRGPGHYWATADVIDEEGSGHLEVTVAGAWAWAWSPPTHAQLRQYPSTTCTERHRPDGSVIIACTTTSPEPGEGVIVHRAILARPDGTVVDVMSNNEDSRTSGRTRPTPPLDAEIVLGKIADLRP